MKTPSPEMRLESLCESIDYGYTASARRDATGPKFLRITDIQNDHVDWELVPRCVVAGDRCSRFELSPGDILFARTGATTGKSFLIRECPQNAIFASYLIRIRPTKQIDSKYLFRFFQSTQYWRQIQKKISGTAQGGFNATKLKDISIPVPGIEEQRRIAKLLDEADAICRKCSKAFELAESFLGSAFQEMFGDANAESNNWKRGTIRDLVSEVKYGTSAKAGAEGVYEILRMNNITYSGQIDLTDIKFIDLDSDDKEKYLVQKGDLLFNRTNSKELVGKSAVYRFDKPRAIAGYLIRIRANHLANTDYISGYLNSPHGKSTLRHMCKSIIGMANINAQQLQDIRISVPPIGLQTKYSELVEKSHELLRKYSASLQSANQIFAALLSASFPIHEDGKSCIGQSIQVEANYALQL